MRSFTSEEGLMAVELDARAAGARRLADKVCVVTGAGQGIGRAVARRLGQEGGRIVVADRIDTSATRTLTELREQGVDALKVLLDLSTFVGAQGLVSQLLDAYGRIDVLVNNVGGTIWIKPYPLYSEEEVKLELERSLYPTLWCCLAVLPTMIKQMSGSIVNLGSQSIPRAIPRPLRSQQRWHIGVEQGAGNGIWPLWHPDQHDVARRYRHY